MKSRNREIVGLDYGIALKFNRHLGSTAVEVPVKFQSDRTIINTNRDFASSCNKTSYHVKTGRGWHDPSNDSKAIISTEKSTLLRMLVHLNYRQTIGAGMKSRFVGPRRTWWIIAKVCNWITFTNASGLIMKHGNVQAALKNKLITLKMLWYVYEILSAMTREEKHYTFYLLPSGTLAVVAIIHFV